MDHLVVLNLHIPLVPDINRSSKKNQVENRKAIYNLLRGRRAVSLAGHTHTVARFLPGEELSGWQEPIPFEQIIVGAASGSWWSGNLDTAGVPASYMRCGAPRGHMIFDFDQNSYSGKYKAHARPKKQQMHLSFINESFSTWYKTITTENNRHENISSDHLNAITTDDLTTGSLVANIWAASRHAQVFCRFDDRQPIRAQWRTDLKDPYALTSQLCVRQSTSDNNDQSSYATDSVDSLPMYYWTVEDRSTHLWHCNLPQDLKPGLHSVTVNVEDSYGHIFKEVKLFRLSTPTFYDARF
jgi:hypothetical protein